MAPQGSVTGPMQALLRYLTRIGPSFAGVLMLAITPMAVLLLHVAETGRADQRDEAQARLMQAARFATTMQTEAVATIRQALGLLGRLPADWAESPEGCVAMMREMVRQHPFMAGLLVVRASGAVLCSHRGVEQGITLADRPYFREALRRPELSIGSPVEARTSGNVVLPMAMRMAVNMERDDDPPLVLAAALDLDRVARLLAGAQNLRGGDSSGSVQVFDTNGRMLAQYPENTAAMVQGHPFNQAVLSAPEGVLDLPGHDGVRRLVGFAHAGEAGTVYAASIPAAAVSGPADQRYRTVAAFGVLAWLAGIVLAFRIVEWRVLDPLAVLSEAARRVRQGIAHTMPREPLPGEFEELRGAMAAMLETLETREASLQVANRDLVRLAGRDALTGIANRRAFDAALAEAFAQAQATGDSVGLAIFDVDFFKKYNDRYGHLQGDECLRKVAATIAGMPIRESDMAARLGGEEFVLLLPATETDGAVAVAQRTIEAIRDRCMLHEDGPAGVVTASCGVASCRPIPGMDPAALIAAADVALYRAKATGRDCVVTARDVASAGVVGEIEAGMQAQA